MLMEQFPLLATEPAEGLSAWAVIMLIFSCTLLYGGFFWCTSIAWNNRHKHTDGDEEETAQPSSTWEQ